MNYENFKKGFEKPSIFTAQQYGTKVSVEVDHSDMDLDEVMDVFQTLIIGMGYHENSFKNWVIDRADEYRETDMEDLKEKLEAWKFEDEDYAGQFEDWKKETPFEDRYLATQEDEDEFSKDGGFDGKPHFEWGDEPEDDTLFEGDEWFANDNLKEANERYKKEVKKMNTKKRNNKN
jgi:hypothetical protein